MHASTTRPETDEYPPYFASYIARVPAGDLLEILEREHAESASLLRASPEHAERRYAPDKWTVKEVLGHLIDSERIFAYRILRFARADRTPLASFDENAYVPAARFGERTLESLLGEFAAVRAGTLSLLDGLPAEAWERQGPASGKEISVRALACMIAGHELHHRDLLRTRYLAAAPAGT